MWRFKLSIIFIALLNHQTSNAKDKGIKSLRIVGVIESVTADSKSIAVIKDIKHKKTYFLKENDEIPNCKGCKVEKISGKKVLLSAEERNINLAYIDQDRSLYSDINRSEIDHSDDQNVNLDFVNKNQRQIFDAPENNLDSQNYDFNKWLHLLKTEEIDEIINAEQIAPIGQFDSSIAP